MGYKIRKVLKNLFFTIIFGSAYANEYQQKENMMNYYSIALELEEKELYQEAITNYHYSLNIAQNILEKDHTHIGTIHNSLGFVYTDYKDYSLAKIHYAKALKIYKKYYQQDSIEIAILYNNIATLYKATQEYNKAIKYFLKAIKIEKVCNEESIIDTYYNLGLLYQKIREYNKAKFYYDKAFDFIKKYNENRLFYLATHYDILGAFYRDKEEYPKALKYYQKTLEIKENLLDINTKDLAQSYHNIASVYEELRDYSTALEYYFRALEMKDKLDNSLDLAITYNNIASSYKELNKNIEAKEYIDSAIKIKESILKKDDIDLAISYNNRGLINDNLKFYNEALSDYNKSLTIYKQNLSEDSYEIAIEYNNIASIYNSKKEYDKAIKYINKSKNILLKVVNKNHTMLSVIYNNLGVIYEILRDYKNAYKYNSLSIKLFLIQKKQNFIILDINQKGKYLKLMSDRVGNLLSSSYLYNLSLKKHNSITTKIITHWLNYKGTINESSNLISMIEKKADKTTKEDIKRLKELTVSLSNLYNNTHKDNSEEIKYIENEISQIQIKLNKNSEKFREFNNLKNISYKDISKYLKEDELYIDFGKTDENYYIFTVDKSNQITFKQVSKEDSKLLEQEIEDFRKINNNKITKEIKDTKKTLNAIYTILNKYINLKSKKSLIISPDGLLNFLPFEALYDGDNYLIESVNISYIPSGRELVRQVRRTNNINSSKDIVIFGNIDYGLNKGKDDTKSLNLIKYLPQLKGSQKEIELLKNIYPKAKIYQKSNATVKNLFTIKSPKILHISTHGKFVENKDISNPMEQNILAFSDANYAIFNKNFIGIATALKLSALNLNNTELVFLSACETGLGTIQTAEGVQGLPKAFIQAGAKNVIMSLWQVDDKATTMLTKYFYENIKNGMNYKTSLRDAKLKMIDMHPYYWSAFILSGV